MHVISVFLQSQSDAYSLILVQLNWYTLASRSTGLSHGSECTLRKSAVGARSYYTLIVSYMHELQTQLPQPHRANCKWFFQSSLETLESDRSYWTPWVFLQLSYHGIYTVINHPFLLTSRLQSLKLKIPNTFWRTSSEAALLHSTWIVRLISLARGKNFELSDPFLSWVAGVAATAQLFYCCSQNDEMRLNARDSFDKCKAFIEDQANVWPWCRGIVSVGGGTL